MEERRTRPLGTLSHRMREARGRLSQERAAATLGLSSGALQEIESGHRDATVGQLLGAAGLYGVDLRGLLFGRAEPDPALAHLGPELADLLQEYLRDRHGVERVAQLNAAQLAELNRIVDQVRRFDGLVGGLLQRGEPSGRAGNALEALAEALSRAERLLAEGGSAGAGYLAQPVRGFTFEARPGDALRARHRVFGDGLDWYERTGGRVADDEAGFQRLLPWLQVLVPTGDGFLYLYCGERTPPAELWGEELARSLVGRLRMPDLRLDHATAEGFIRIHETTRPLIQAASGPVLVDGRRRRDAWHRVVMPLRFRGLACVASLAVRDASPQPPAA